MINVLIETFDDGFILTLTYAGSHMIVDQELWNGWQSIPDPKFKGGAVIQPDGVSVVIGRTGYGVGEITYTMTGETNDNGAYIFQKTHVDGKPVSASN